jgi:hypothetical protein
MHVAVNKSRQDQVSSIRDRFRCWWRQPLPDCCDGFATYCDVTFPNDGFGGYDSAGDHAVE